MSETQNERKYLHCIYPSKNSHPQYKKNCYKTLKIDNPIFNAQTLHKRKYQYQKGQNLFENTLKLTGHQGNSHPPEW